MSIQNLKKATFFAAFPHGRTAKGAAAGCQTGRGCGTIPANTFMGPPAPHPDFDGAGPAHPADAGLIRPSPGGWGRNMFLHRLLPFYLIAFGGSAPGPFFVGPPRPHTPGHFLYGQKVTKKPHKGGTLSMGSLPCGSLPRDDTKGGACPPLDTPAEAEACPLSNTLSSIRITIHFSRSWCGFLLKGNILKTA